FRYLGMDEPPENGDYVIPLGRYLKDVANIDTTTPFAQEIMDQQGWATKRPWNADGYPHIAAWLKTNEKPLALAVDAVKRPAYFNPVASRRSGKEPGMLIGALLPGVQKCREMATMLTARAMLRASEGKTDEAWQDLLACHRLGRHLSHGCTLIEGL